MATKNRIDEPVSYEIIWDRLFKIDCKDRIQKRNNLSYLSWAWAWQIMMENYPQIEYEFDEPFYHNDGTCSVHCTVRIDQCDRSMWLPVMTGFKNTAVKNPDARDIGDAKMRCLVKVFAMFGLGHYIYAGEDIPQTQSNERARTKEKASASNSKPNEEVTTEKMDVHRSVEEVMIGFLGDIKTIDDLKKFWTDNSIALKDMEKEDPDRYQNVLGLFKDRKEAI